MQWCAGVSKHTGPKGVLSTESEMADFASSALDNMETRRGAVGGAIELPLARCRFRLLLKVSRLSCTPTCLA
jgi:hypothetical protein